MPNVKIDWNAGRTQEQKDKVAKAITEAISTIGGARAEGTYVVFRDVPKDNWASGGTLLSDK